MLRNTREIVYFLCVLAEKTKQAAKQSLLDYLAFYNGRRSHSICGYQSPLQFEREYLNNVAG